MKKALLFLSVFLFSCLSLQSQTGDPHPCGTIDGRSAWLKKFQANPHLPAYQKDDDSTLYVPLTIHLAGSDGGTGYYPLPRLLDALCTLNNDFADTEIQFYIEGEINYLPNAAYNNHESVVDGAYMMFENNVENTLNCYVMDNPAGNCGYNLPYAGIALNESCMGPADHTWSHEIGHAFSLPHPFIGWEGGVGYDGSISHNFNNPAPLTVLYDYTNFQDSFYVDTLIIDTAFVEMVDGSNCHIAADGFCDTPPDYLSARWNCNNSNQSTSVQTDPNGVQFVSDGTLIMSYSADECQSRFSDEQIAAMQANLLDEKPHLLYNQEPGIALSSEPLVLYAPIEGEVAQFDEVYFDWEEIEGATSYFVQVSRFASFNVIEEYTTDTNSLVVNDLQNNKTYYWRVKPYNAYSFCTVFSETGTFETGEVTNVRQLSETSSLLVYPNLLQDHQAVNLQLEALIGFQLNAQLVNSVGQVITQDQFQIHSGLNQFQFTWNQKLADGTYFLKLSNASEVVFEKIIVAQ